MPSRSQQLKETPILPASETDPSIASPQVRRYVQDEEVLDLYEKGIDDEEAKQIAVELADIWAATRLATTV
jgi:hypothetical protein